MRELWHIMSDVVLVKIEPWDNSSYNFSLTFYPQGTLMAFSNTNFPMTGSQQLADLIHALTRLQYIAYRLECGDDPRQLEVRRH
jgi:hypothetical protein